ncbi:hypothetical protein DID76_01480 [Candidatus Marinamargulisbacteria bacterium SCGC AG-414-C22]|nr:hypothetical protein DID76_01480 [Candidatus Marinamargulisbacteria bacterium SCGC AG-414-C22]
MLIYKNKRSLLKCVLFIVFFGLAIINMSCGTASSNDTYQDIHILTPQLTYVHQHSTTELTFTVELIHGFSMASVEIVGGSGSIINQLNETDVAGTISIELTTGALFPTGSITLHITDHIGNQASSTLPFNIYPTFNITTHTASAYDGLALFSESINGDNITYLIDHHGTIIQRWLHHDLNAVSMPYLTSDKRLIYPYKASNLDIDTGGSGGGIQIISWSGEILWDYRIANETYQHHHDIEPLPNGNLLVLVWHRKTIAEAEQAGRQSMDGKVDLWSEAIFELEPIGTNQANIVWEWYMWDHLIQDVDATLDHFGVIADAPELMDINTGTVGRVGQAGSRSWMHFNTIDYNEDHDFIILTSRRQNEIYVIDHSTTTLQAATHAGGTFGKGGDFLYRWGNPMNYDHGTSNDTTLSAPHSGIWIDNYLPGAGNIIVFNNNVGGSESSIIEFTPPFSNNQFTKTTSMAFEPTTYQTMTANFFSPRQSSVIRLPNGNTFIASAVDGQLIELDTNGNVAWHLTVEGVKRALMYPADYSHD